MVAMTPGISVETGTQGGVVAALKRSVLGGESFFVNTFRADASAGGELILAPHGRATSPSVSWPVKR